MVEVFGEKVIFILGTSGPLYLTAAAVSTPRGTESAESVVMEHLTGQGGAELQAPNIADAVGHQ